MKRLMLGVLLAAAALYAIVAPSWGAAALDDVARDVNALRAEIIKLSAQVDSVRIEMGRLYTIILSLFGALAALFAGLLYFVFDISRSLRVPKEERISKLEAFMEKVKDHLREIDDKLHLPKPLL